MINPDGSGLERVTDYGAFTSFPEFSPDGKKLLFASSYKSTSKYEFNISPRIEVRATCCKLDLSDLLVVLVPSE